MIKLELRKPWNLSAKHFLLLSVTDLGRSLRCAVAATAAPSFARCSSGIPSPLTKSVSYRKTPRCSTIGFVRCWNSVSERDEKPKIVPAPGVVSKRRTNCKRAGLSKRRWNAKSLHLTALETTYARTRRQEPLYSTKEGLVSRMEKGKRMEIKNPSNGPTSAALRLINLIGYLTLTLFE